MITRVLKFSFTLLVLATPAGAVDFSDLDLSVKTGIVTGTIKLPGLTDPYTFGGFPMIAAYNLDLTRNWVVSAELGLVLDTKNFQITRTGLECAAAYHLMGGPRHLKHDYVKIDTVGHDQYNLSLGTRVGFQNYSAAAELADGTPITAEGSDLEILLGLQYRQDYSESTSFAAEVYMTAFALAASTQKLTTSSMLFLLSWRFYL